MAPPRRRFPCILLFLAIALTGGSLLALLRFSPGRLLWPPAWFSAESEAPSAGAPRREGAWVVTPLGSLRAWDACPERDRLLIGCEGRRPEPWNTDKGERVAVLSQHRQTLQASAWSPDKDRFVTAPHIGYFNDI